MKMEAKPSGSNDIPARDWRSTTTEPSGAGRQMAASWFGKSRHSTRRAHEAANTSRNAAKVSFAAKEQGNADGNAGSDRNRASANTHPDA